jgi:hypothetical protein
VRACLFKDSGSEGDIVVDVSLKGSGVHGPITAQKPELLERRSKKDVQMVYRDK